jgi:EthD domain
MIKVVSLFKRKKGTTHAQFREYYENKHVKIFRELHGLPGYERYVRRYLTPIKRLSPSDAQSAEFDVIMENWFSRQVYERFFEGAQPLDTDFLKTVAEDEEKLFDRTQMFVHNVEEYDSYLPTSDHSWKSVLNDPKIKKVAILGKKKQTMTSQKFRDYYENEHARLILKYLQVPGLARYTRRYLTPMIDIITGNTPLSGIDVITELWFSDNDLFEKYVRHGTLLDANAAEIIAADEEKFLDRGQMVAFAIEEYDAVLSQTSLGASLRRSN